MTSPSEELLRQTRADLEQCLSIMEHCTTRDEILRGFAEAAGVLSTSANPLGEEAGRLLRAGGSMGDEDVTRLMEGFVAECRGFLSSVTRWEPDELDRLREAAHRQP